MLTNERQNDSLLYHPKKKKKKNKDKIEEIVDSRNLQNENRWLFSCKSIESRSQAGLSSE